MSFRQRGVTLIELMIVVVIVGILAGIAIPAYRAYVIRANRVDAKNALLSAAQNLERCYTNSTPYAYNSATCTASVVRPFTLATGTYRIENMAVADPVNMWQLRAVPLGAQANDALCRNFVLDQAGIQTVTGTASATPQECWRR